MQLEHVVALVHIEQNYPQGEHANPATKNPSLQLIQAVELH